MTAFRFEKNTKEKVKSFWQKIMEYISFPISYFLFIIIVIIKLRVCVVFISVVSQIITLAFSWLILKTEK